MYYSHKTLGFVPFWGPLESRRVSFGDLEQNSHWVHLMVGRLDLGQLDQSDS